MSDRGTADLDYDALFVFQFFSEIHCNILLCVLFFDTIVKADIRNPLRCLPDPVNFQITAAIQPCAAA